MRSFAALAAVLGLVVACRPAAAPVPTSTHAVPTTTPAPDSLRGPWTIRNAGRPRAAVVELRGVITARRDSVVSVDSVDSRTEVQWSIAPDSQPRRVLGLVRGFAVRRAGDSTWMAVPNLPLPVTFAATQEREGAQPRFVTPAEAGCEARSAVVQAFRETWLAPPPRLDAGTRWQDSSRYAVCRDGIVLTVVSQRVFVVEGAAVRDGRLVLRVRRESLGTLEGRGLQFGDSVRVRGESTGRAVFEMSPDGGAVVAGEGTSELRLELRGRRRTQQLVQTGALTIRSP